MRTVLTLLISAMMLFPGVAADRAQVKNWQVYFSPHGGCAEAVVEALGRAKSTVLVQAYSFTSAPIPRALVEAHRRGVKVEVVPNTGILKCQDGIKGDVIWPHSRRLSAPCR
jgi:phosphatidylserine/phosphatidylglycerophosphate/cardiolipin synthase-like enzyme